MGFPAGLRGAELANRGYLQALKFGVEFTAPISVLGIERLDSGEQALELCSGQTIRSRAVLIATGASYRRLPVENARTLRRGRRLLRRHLGRGAHLPRATAIVVGGGNSAGQAAMYLSQQAAKVKIVIRGDDLGKSMSRYLVQRIEQRAQHRGAAQHRGRTRSTASGGWRRSRCATRAPETAALRLRGAVQSSSAPSRTRNGSTTTLPGTTTASCGRGRPSRDGSTLAGGPRAVRARDDAPGRLRGGRRAQRHDQALRVRRRRRRARRDLRALVPCPMTAETSRSRRKMKARRSCRSLATCDYGLERT